MCRHLQTYTLLSGLDRLALLSSLRERLRVESCEQHQLPKINRTDHVRILLDSKTTLGLCNAPLSFSHTSRKIIDCKWRG